MVVLSSTSDVPNFTHMYVVIPLNDVKDRRQRAIELNGDQSFVELTGTDTGRFWVKRAEGIVSNRYITGTRRRCSPRVLVGSWAELSAPFPSIGKRRRYQRRARAHVEDWQRKVALPQLVERRQEVFGTVLCGAVFKYAEHVLRERAPVHLVPFFPAVAVAALLGRVRLGCLGHWGLGGGCDRLGLLYGNLLWALEPEVVIDIPVPDSGLDKGQLVASIFAHIVAAQILRFVEPRQTLIAQNVPAVIAMALDTQAVDRDVHVVYTTLANEDTLKAASRPHCRMFLSREMFYSPSSPAKLDKDPKGPGIIGALLWSAFDFSQKIDPEEKAGVTVYWAAMLPLDQVARATDPPDHLSVIDWTSTKPVPVRPSRLDSVPMLKSKGSTYWILMFAGIYQRRDPQRCIAEGLRGDPRNSPSSTGRNSRGDDLRDTAIENMGINLDRLFYDTDLDLLVFVSSVNCMVGNVGQANCAAANTFLGGLAAQRRKRGLRTAAVNIGAIIGAGYLERESRIELDAIVQRLNLLRLSEEDWHQSICEAINNAARLDLPFSSFLITEAALKKEADGKTVVTVGELLRLGEVRVDGRGKLDWDSESHPPADMPNVISIQYARYPPRIVLLTECTGLLGRYLLTHLLLEPGVEKVICLAVRSLARRREQGRLPQDPRVVFYEGDLTQSILGLSKEEVALVFNEADVVIHNGSDTSHLKHYADLRPANVKSTALLARLFIRRRITLHYVSSAGVGIFHEKSGTEGFPSGPVELGFDWESDGSFGYICGKLRVCIHWPSAIIREGVDAIGEEAKKDWVNALLTFVNKLKAAPKVERNQGVLDLVHVRNVCQSIMGHVFSGSPWEEGAIRFVHEVGDLLVPLKRLSLIGLEESHGTPFHELTIEECVAKAVLAGLHPGVGALITEKAEGGREYPRLLKGNGTSMKV
ncbi:lovastatin nonaketide synthase [Seiridium cupressi]